MRSASWKSSGARRERTHLRLLCTSTAKAEACTGALLTAFEMIEIPYVFSGFAVGFVVGMTGVGGGSLMTPLLVLLFGVHPATAVGTDLLYAAITKSCGTAVHHIGNTVEWRRHGATCCRKPTREPDHLLLMLHHFDIGSNALGELIPYILGYALLLTTLSLPSGGTYSCSPDNFRSIGTRGFRLQPPSCWASYSELPCRYPRSVPARSA